MPERPRLPVRLLLTTTLARLWPALCAGAWLAATAPCHAGSTMSWSPDGRWLAYVTVDSPRPIPEGWLFGPPSAERAKNGNGTSAPSATKSAADNQSRRLWVTRSDGRFSALLESSSGPITAPAWRGDGGAILFGRVVLDPNGKPIRYEAVMQDAPSRQRILRKIDLAPNAAIPANLAGLRPSWSPNGRIAALPWPTTWGLGILRISGESAEWAGELADGLQPTWAPDSRRLAYLRRDGDRFVLCWTDAELKGDRRLIDLGPAKAAPRWGWDGPNPNKTAVALRIDPSIRQSRSSLIQISVETNQGSRSLRAWDSSKNGDVPQSALAVSADGEVLFHSETPKDMPQGSQLVQVMLKRDEVYAKTSALDVSRWIIGLELSPQAVLAATIARGGPPSSGDFTDLDVSPPLLITMPLTSKEELLLQPDDSTRSDWLNLIVATIRELIQNELKAPRLDGAEIERPYGLPCLGELEWGDPRALRLRKLALLGSDLVEKLEASKREQGQRPDPERTVALDELRLGFLCLLGDNEVALEVLDRVEERMNAPAERVRATWLRSQLWANQGRYAEARACLDAPGVQPRPERLVEETPLGLRLQETPAPPDWVKLLRQGLADLENGKAVGWRKASDRPFDPNEPSGPGVLIEDPEKIQIQLPPIR